VPSISNTSQSRPGTGVRAGSSACTTCVGGPYHGIGPRLVPIIHTHPSSYMRISALKHDQVLNAHVSDKEGNLLQLTIGASFHQVVGAGLERCTNPNYVDWSPDACPNTAPDLFLSFHSYYWPILLERPDDAGSELSQKR
jgi:hypothetical protein